MPNEFLNCCAAARLRSDAKRRKYADLVSSTGSQFLPAVLERFGAFSGALQALVKMVAGDGDCDPLRDEWTFSASSRITSAAQQIVLAAVVGDALMVEALCMRDAFGAHELEAPPFRRAKAPMGLFYAFAEVSQS